MAYSKSWDKHLPEIRKWVAEDSLVDDSEFDADPSLFRRQRLTPRELVVLTARFGLDGQPRKTLVETGKLFPGYPISSERVRQIEANGVDRLRWRAKVLKAKAEGRG